MELYDDFSGVLPDEEKWQIASVPLGGGNFWHYKDNNAFVGCNDGICTISISKFTNSNDHVQIFDNPKQLYLTPDAWATGSGPVSFKATMSGHVTGNPDDYRDGFASFNVLDFASAMVFDLVCNGSHIWAIYERLLIPGMTSAEEAFTEVIDLGVETSAEQFHEFKISYDRDNNRVRYIVDGVECLVRENLPVPVNQLTTGFGLITLHPIEEGKSVSCKGQGGTCRVGSIFVPD